ncbi:MAG: Luciferase-like, subgroup [Acidimicrobiales bacterium]|nr:Luciferase-like, subgroup [Acidimicrobiales bacterium]
MATSAENARMKVSVALPPGPAAVELATLAEQLGYARVWFFDSPPLYEDVWVTVAQVVDRTGIDVGTAVLVPSLRHPMTTASAIATIERIAPGRLTCGFGTGGTACWVMGQPTLRWADTRRHVEQVRALLDGEVVVVDGGACQMIHLPAHRLPRPIRTPLLLSALGPKGTAITRELAAAGVVDGVITFSSDDPGLDRRLQIVPGTVLDAGETLTDQRVKLAAGPWYLLLAYHGLWQMAPEAVRGVPGGNEWLAGINAERPAGERHLAVHEGHVTDVQDRDRPLLDAAPDGLAQTGWIGDRDDIAGRVEASAAAGVSELLYAPAGPDVTREIRAFATAAIG